MDLHSEVILTLHFNTLPLLLNLRNPRWIYSYLINYQQIALPTKVKETFFFDNKFAQGADWYYSHFTQLESSQKVGEIAPSYFHSSEAAKRIYQINPNCKIIVTLRQPVSRLVSFYLHMKQRG